jgi:hypothetical protein
MTTERRITLREVENGFIVSYTGYSSTEKVFLTFDHVVQELAFYFGRRNVGEQWVTKDERNDGK